MGALSARGTRATQAARDHYGAGQARSFKAGALWGSFQPAVPGGAASLWRCAPARVRVGDASATRGPGTGVLRTGANQREPVRRRRCRIMGELIRRRAMGLAAMAAHGRQTLPSGGLPDFRQLCVRGVLSAGFLRNLKAFSATRGFRDPAFGKKRSFRALADCSLAPSGTFGRVECDAIWSLGPGWRQVGAGGGSGLPGHNAKPGICVREISEIVRPLETK